MSTTDKGQRAQLTPEQQANLKNFGKKNGLSDQVVNSQLNIQQESNQPVSPAPRQQQVVQRQVAKPQVVPQAAPPVAPPQVASMYYNEQESSCDTYYKYGNEESISSLEIDLITFREKGFETRFLSLLMGGFDTRVNPPSPQTAYLAIETKEEFEELKAFFAQLNWED